LFLLLLTQLGTLTSIGFPYQQKRRLTLFWVVFSILVTSYCSISLICDSLSAIRKQSNPMPHLSDSNYAAVTRHRRPFTVTGRPSFWDSTEDHLKGEDTVAGGGGDGLGDDDIVLGGAALQSGSGGAGGGDDGSGIPLQLLLLDDDADASSSAVTPNSAAAANAAAERRRREEGWNDLALDVLLNHGTFTSISQTQNNARSSSSSSATSQAPPADNASGS
jgi:hypothetical protein